MNHKKNNKHQGKKRKEEALELGKLAGGGPIFGMACTACGHSKKGCTCGTGGPARRGNRNH